MFKIRAFTLAEVLLVLAVIGITAAVALPALNDGMEDRKIVAQLRKDYAELDSAYNAVIANIGPYHSWDKDKLKSGTSSNVTEYLYDEMLGEKGYLKIKQGCKFSASGCFTSNSTIENSSSYAKFVLNDGAFVGIICNSMALIKALYLTTPDDGYVAYCSLKVDVNGFKGENQDTYDTFTFEMTDKGLVPDGMPYSEGGTIYPSYATAWVIKAGNRDYLKCSGLDWKTKRTCD